MIIFFRIEKVIHHWGENMKFRPGLKRALTMLSLAIIIFISCGFASAQEISEYGIIDFAEPYAREDEVMKAYGIYYLEDRPFWVIAFYDGDDLMGEIVLDANTGDIIKNENMVRKILYTSWVESFIDYDSIAEDISMVESLKNALIIFESDSSLYREIANRSYYKENIRNNASNVATSYQLIADDYLRCASILEEMIDLENQIIEKNFDVKITEAYLNKGDQFVSELDILSGHIDKTRDGVVVLYDNLIDNTYNQAEKRELQVEKQNILTFFSKEHQFISLIKSDWTSFKSDINASIDWEIEEMQDRFELAEVSDEASGFEAIFAIVLLLATVYIIGKRE